MKRSRKIKTLYGIGFSSMGIKDALFQLFLFFYFSQILGLSATYTGLATIIALFFDAISDPWIGTLSDRWVSKKYGRRHPFMYAAALPLGATLFLLFSPPNGLNEFGLFLWLTFFSTLVRVALTFFIVPGMSLGAELSDDYDERTSITSYRVMFGSLIGPILLMFGLLVFFTPTAEHANGLFNEAAYSKFALLCGILAALAIVISTYGTQSTISSLPKVKVDSASKDSSSTWKSLREAIQLKSYSSLVFYIMIVYIGLGIGMVFTTYFTTYFFELSEKELAGLPITSALGGISALFLAPIMGQIFDKKRSVIISTFGLGIFFASPYLLRFLNLFPENNTALLVPVYFLTLWVAYTFLWIAISITNSMMAEVVDEYESLHQKRNEGFFFSTMSFAYKCTVGFGYFFAGILLDLIQFPKQVTQIDSISPEVINGLGLIGGPLILLIYLSAILFIMHYPINKSSHQTIKKIIQNASLN